MEKEWWDEVYSEARNIPWDTGIPSRELKEFIEKGLVKPCRALDICCGTGTEAIYLAKNGFEVSGIDISKKAIAIAREKAEKEKLIVDFRTGDVLNMPYPDSFFGFVNDRGCFHTFSPDSRSDFAREVWRVIESSGLYLLRCFNDREPGSFGPYRISRKILDETFSGFFEFLSVEDIEIIGKRGTHSGYMVLMRKKGLG